MKLLKYTETVQGRSQVDNIALISPPTRTSPSTHGPRCLQQGRNQEPAASEPQVDPGHRRDCPEDRSQGGIEAWVSSSWQVACVRVVQLGLSCSWQVELFVEERE